MGSDGHSDDREFNRDLGCDLLEEIHIYLFYKLYQKDLRADMTISQ